MHSPEIPFDVIDEYGPVPGPSLADSPSGSDSSESHVSFDLAMMPPEEQCLDYTPVFPGDWQEEDANSLQEQGWSNVPVEDRVHWRSYVPFWTRPDWDPSIEVTINGSMQRAIRGEPESFMRPTILRRDNAVPRTEYTKRWGVNPAIPKTADNEARSGLTPVTAVAGDPDAQRLWTHEESWQSYWFDSFTTQELLDIGAYAPDDDIPMSDLPEDCLNPLFGRERWKQPVIDVGLGGSPSRIRNLDIRYSLGGKTNRFDAENNDDLWAALQPSLRLASNVINSQHPVWMMFLRAIYHMRKVPMAKDGRTDREKIQPEYRQYRTLYAEIDEDQMYDNARSLWRLGFDPGQATTGILLEKLKWGFIEVQPHSNGSTFTGPDHSIRIFLNANAIWGLLVDEYSESEKVAIRVKLAMTMLHEMAHACHQAHHQMLEEPGRSLANISGVKVTKEIEAYLRGLRTEAIGPGSRWYNGRQYFIENDVAMEEGKALDQRIWGAVVDYFPPLSAPSKFRPMVQTRNWPFTHPEIYHQNAEAVRAGAYSNFTRTPYTAFLLFPRAAVYDLFTPIPLSNYSHLLRASWWVTDFRKYGHEAMKISSTRADQSYPLQSALSFKYNNFKSLLIPLVGKPAVVRFLFTTAPSILRAQNKGLILAWLFKTSLEIAGSKIMRLRLHYERKTWDDKYGGIRNLCQKIIQDVAAARESLKSYLSDTPPDEDTDVIDLDQVSYRLNTLFRQDLVELHRLVDHEGRYSQCIAAEYFIKELDHRRLLRRSMHALLGHLQETCDEVGGVLVALLDIWSEMGASHAFADQVVDCEGLYSRINTAKTAIFGVVQVLRGNTLDQRSGPGGRGPLAAVPAAARELRNGRNLRAAAMKEYALVSDPRLKRVIKTWLDIIRVGMDIRLDDPDAEDVVVGGGSIAELERARDQATADALAISYLDRQEQVEANRAKGMEQPEGDDRVAAELREEMEQLEVQSEILDLYAHSFSEEEQDRLRRKSI